MVVGKGGRGVLVKSVYAGKLSSNLLNCLPCQVVYSTVLRGDQGGLYLKLFYFKQGPVMSDGESPH